MPIILNNLWIILLLPLLGAAINGLFGKQWPQTRVNIVALSSVALTFLAVIELAREFWRSPRRKFRGCTLTRLDDCRAFPRGFHFSDRSTHMVMLGWFRASGC